MKFKKLLILFSFSLYLNINLASASEFQSTVKGWSSYKDVASWLKNEWQFDKDVARDVARTVRSEGPGAVSVKTAEETFNSPVGWCKDAANFAKGSLNLIDDKYKAEYIFIKNKVTTAPNHWVTGFKDEGKLYVIDYGAGSHWESLEGIHGPYNSLEEYRDFLANLNIDNFQVDFVRWMFGSGAAGKPGNMTREKRKAYQRAINVLGKFDTNGDKGISRDEAPGRMKANFARLDKDGNGQLSEEELRRLPPRP